MTLAVHDLFFGHRSSVLYARPQAQENDIAPKFSFPDAKLAGWCGGQAPGIPQDAWPRSPVTGFPMIHVLTLELPPAYRRRGPAFVAIAFFQADDHIARETPGAGEILQGRALTDAEAALPFYADLARAHAARHPDATPLEDIIGGHFTLIWLREGELRGPRIHPPADHRAGLTLPEPDQNLNAWDHTKPPVEVYLVQRAYDPNAGLVPSEEDSPAGYVDVILSEDPELQAFFEEVHGRSHLGGTCFPIQAMPAGLTPYYLELEDDVGGANFGGGNMQLDLESGVFDWACG